jgi:folate-binding protein YgfZ
MMAHQPDTSKLAWHPLPRERGVLIRGADSLDWLQGQVTQDLRELAMGEVRLAALASPTGQVVDVLSISRVLRGIVVLGQNIEALMERVDRFVITEDVEAEFLDGPVWTVQGGRAIALQDHDAVDLGDQIWVRRRRSLAGGWDVWGVEDVRPLMPQEQFEAESILSGVPVLGVDTTEKTLVSELGEAFLSDHVSYTKGCYVGQEVIHRIHARGHVNKLWLAVRMAEFVQAPAVVTAEGKEVGTLLRSAVHPEMGPVGRVMVKREALLSTSGLRAEGVACLLLGVSKED